MICWMVFKRFDHGFRSGYSSAASSLDVTDVESLTLSVATTAFRKKRAQRLSLSRAATSTSVSRWWSLCLAATPAKPRAESVTIPAGETSVVFVITAVDDTWSMVLCRSPSAPLRLAISQPLHTDDNGQRSFVPLAKSPQSIRRQRQRLCYGPGRPASHQRAQYAVRTNSDTA